MAQSGRPIPMPLKVRLLQIRRRFLPGALFFCCAMLTLWMWRRQETGMTIQGQVEAVQVVVSATADGMLATLPDEPQMFDPVLANTSVVARLDDAPILSEIAVLQGESARLGAQLTAEQERLEVEQEQMSAEQARLEFDRQRNRTDQQGQIAQFRRELVESQLLRNQLALQRIELISDQVVATQEMKRLEDRLEHTQVLVEKELTSTFAIQDVGNEISVLEARIEQNQKAVEAVDLQIASAEASISVNNRRLSAAVAQFESDHVGQTPSDSSSGLVLTNVEAILKPIQRAIDVQELRIANLLQRAERLEIRAPVDGTITAVHRQPGTWVRMGDPLLTIAANRADFIVAYVSAHDRRRVAPDMAVDVLVGNPRRNRFRAKIRRVGPQYEPLPERFQRDGAATEWGLPVQIDMPEGAEVLPGEVVEVLIPRVKDAA